MFSSFPTHRSGRGASSRSNKSDNTFLTPLLDDSFSDSSDDSEDSSTVASYETPKNKLTVFQMLKLGVVNIVLLGGVAASVAAMIPSPLLLSPSLIVYIAGAITIINVPYSSMKEARIATMPNIRSLNDKLRDEAHRLEEEVDALSEEIDAIAPEAERASAIEEELREIAERQQFSVDKLIDLVNEDEQVLEQMRDNLKSKIVQDIIRIVINSDVNNDQKFCKVESKMLALKIRIQLQEYGVDFDEMKFYRVMNVCPTIPRVIAIVQKLIPKVVGDDDSDSTNCGDEDDYDMFRLASDRSFGSIQDVPQERRASSVLVRNSSWRGALRTSHRDESLSGDNSSRQMSEAQQITLALSSRPKVKKKRSSLSLK